MVVRVNGPLYFYAATTYRILNTSTYPFGVLLGMQCCAPCVHVHAHSRALYLCGWHTTLQVSDLVAGAESLEAAAASAKALREAAEASTQQTKEGNSRGGEAGPSGADDVVATAASSNPSELAMPASWVCDHVAGPLQGEVRESRDYLWSICFPSNGRARRVSSLAFRMLLLFVFLFNP